MRLTDLYSLTEVHDHILPIAFLLVDDHVYQVRLTALRVVRHCLHFVAGNYVDLCIYRIVTDTYIHTYIHMCIVTLTRVFLLHTCTCFPGIMLRLDVEWIMYCRLT